MNRKQFEDEFKRAAVEFGVGGNDKVLLPVLGVMYDNLPQFAQWKIEEILARRPE